MAIDIDDVMNAMNDEVLQANTKRRVAPPSIQQMMQQLSQVFGERQAQQQATGPMSPTAGLVMPPQAGSVAGQAETPASFPYRTPMSIPVDPMAAPPRQQAGPSDIAKSAGAADMSHLDPLMIEATRSRLASGLGSSPREIAQGNQQFDTQNESRDAIDALVAGAANKQRKAPALMPLAPAGSLTGGQRVPTSFIAGSYTQGEMSPGLLARASEKAALRRNRMEGGGLADMNAAQMFMAKQAEQMFPEEPEPEDNANPPAGADPMMAMLQPFLKRPSVRQMAMDKIFGRDPNAANAALGALAAAINAGAPGRAAIDIQSAQAKQTRRDEVKKRLAEMTDTPGIDSYETFKRKARFAFGPDEATDKDIDEAWVASGHSAPAPAPPPLIARPKAAVPQINQPGFNPFRNPGWGEGS